MIKICLFSGIGAAIVIACAAASPSMSNNAVLTPPFQPHVDMKTFMEHVSTFLENPKNAYDLKASVRF